MSNAIGEAIRQAREEKKVSLKALSSRTYLPFTTLNDIEHGALSTLNASTLESIEEGLGLYRGFFYKALLRQLNKKR